MMDRQPEQDAEARAAGDPQPPASSDRNPDALSSTSPELPPDAEFVDWLRSGDASIVKTLTARCERVASRQFSSWAWDWIRDDFVADLLAQLTNAVRKDHFELRGSAGAYVDTAIRNLCRRSFRDLARLRRGVPLDTVEEQPASAERDALAQVAAVADLKRALAQLSAECRALIQRKYVAGESLRKIGDDLGVAEKTARSRLHSCRQKLRQLFWGASTLQH